MVVRRLVCMPARVPLDVDLEDKLLYGLTPMRLVYLVVALLTAFSVWSSHSSPGAVGGGAAIIVVVVGAAAAWGRWRGRAADGWIADIALYAVSNYRLQFGHRNEVD